MVIIRYYNYKILIGRSSAAITLTKNETSFLTMQMGILNKYHVFDMIKVVMYSTFIKVYTLLC